MRELTTPEMLDKCLRIAKEHFYKGDDNVCSFTYEHKNDAVRVANYLRKEFVCSIRSEDGLNSKILHTVFVDNPKIK